VTGEVQPVL
jgi:hypothetical protein